MIRKGIVVHIVSFFLYILVQVALFKNIVIFDKGFCFIYIAFLLLLPIETNVVVLMFLGFLTGFTVDIFYDSLGIHASASVFIMFARNYWLNLLTPQGGYESNAVPTIRLNGWQWFSFYSLPLIFVHQTILFFVESAEFDLFGFTLSKVVFSTIFTFIILMISQYLFYNRRKGI